MMKPESVEAVARDMGIAIRTLGRSEVDEIASSLRKRKVRTVWESLEGSSVYGSDAWRRIGRLPGRRFTLLFENPHLGFQFESSTDVVAVLAELPISVFYVITDDGDVAAFNDHDYLIATGSAQEILE